MPDPITWTGSELIAIWNSQLGHLWKPDTTPPRVSYKDFHPMPTHEVLLATYQKMASGDLPYVAGTEGASCTYHTQVLHAHLLTTFVMQGRGRYAGGWVGRNDSAEPSIGQDDNHAVCWFVDPSQVIWFIDSTRGLSNPWYYNIREGDGDFYGMMV